MVVDLETTSANLRRVLQAISTPQSAAARPQQLALEFDDVALVFMSNFGHTLSDETRQRLAMVNSWLADLSDEQGPDLWTTDAFVRHPRWVQVRAAAEHALAGLASDGCP